MRMHNPPHPGAVLRELCLEPLGLSVSEAARGLGGQPEDFVGHLERAGRDQPRDGDSSFDR